MKITKNLLMITTLTMTLMSQAYEYTIFNFTGEPLKNVIITTIDGRSYDIGTVAFTPVTVDVKSSGIKTFSHSVITTKKGTLPRIFTFTYPQEKPNLVLHGKPTAPSLYWDDDPNDQSKPSLPAQGSWEIIGPR